MAPSSRARRPARRFQATAPPRWRGPVLCFSVSAGPPATPRQCAAGIGAAARTAQGRGRCPACVCVGSRERLAPVPADTSGPRLRPRGRVPGTCRRSRPFQRRPTPRTPLRAAARRRRRGAGARARRRSKAHIQCQSRDVQIKHASAVSLRRRARCPASAPARRPAPPCSCPPAWRRRAPVSAPGHRLECLRAPQASIHPSGCLGTRAGALLVGAWPERRGPLCCTESATRGGACEMMCCLQSHVRVCARQPVGRRCGYRWVARARAGGARETGCSDAAGDGEPAGALGGDRDPVAGDRRAQRSRAGCGPGRICSRAPANQQARIPSAGRSICPAAAGRLA